MFRYIQVILYSIQSWPWQHADDEAGYVAAAVATHLFYPAVQGGYPARFGFHLVLLVGLVAGFYVGQCRTGTDTAVGR